MTDSKTASSQIARAERGGGALALEDLVARVPIELLAAASTHAEAFDQLEHDFWTDPCHFLRRACQTADYGSEELRA